MSHPVRFNAIPFVVYPIDYMEPIASFIYRIDAFDFARKETLPNPARGDTGYPFLCVDAVRPSGTERYIFRDGKLVDKHGTVIE